MTGGVAEQRPRWRSLVGGVLLLVVLSGCFGRPLPTPSVPLPTATELQQQLDATAGRYRSVRGLAKVSVTRGDESLSLTQAILVGVPDRLRVEALSPFGTTLLVLAADGTELSVYLPGQNTFYRGAATAANVARFTRLPLRLDDLVGLLLGNVPRFAANTASVARDQNNVVLELSGDGAVRQQFVFNPDGRLLQAAYLVGAQLQLQVEYAEFADNGNGAPQHIVLRMPPLQVEADIRFSEIVANVELAAHRFRQTPPDGSRIQPLPED